MLERFQALFVYVGSAAFVAFLAASAGSPQVATFSCHSVKGSTTEQCEPVATLSANAPDRLESAAASGENANPPVRPQGPATLAR